MNRLVHILYKIDSRKCTKRGLELEEHLKYIIDRMTGNMFDRFGIRCVPFIYYRQYNYFESILFNLHTQ